MSGSQRLAAAFLLLLLALQWLWHAWLAPGTLAPPWLVASLYSLPLLPPLFGLLRRRRHAAMWGGIVALFYFCHGIAETRAAPAERLPALVEVAASIALVFAAGWPGLKAKLLRRKAAPPPNV